MIFVAASDDDDPEKIKATIKAVHARLHAAVEASLVDVDPIDARIIKICLSAKTNSENPSYDGKLQQLDECFGGLLQVLRDLRPASQKVWEEYMPKCEAAVAAVEKELHKEMRGDNPVH